MAKNIEDFRNLELEDVNKFWQDFEARHPEIEMQLRNGRTFINGSISAFKPATLDDNSYAIYERYLRRWLSDNDLWHKQPDLIYVALDDGANKGVRAIDTSTITAINGISGTLSSVTIKESDMDEPITIFVKEYVEDLRKSIYIF